MSFKKDDSAEFRATSVQHVTDIFNAFAQSPELEGIMAFHETVNWAMSEIFAFDAFSVTEECIQRANNAVLKAMNVSQACFDLPQAVEIVKQAEGAMDWLDQRNHTRRRFYGRLA